MARIAGENIPPNKRLVISLTYIYGIGLTSAQKICKNTGISINTRVKDLRDQDLVNLRNEIDTNFHVEGILEKK